MANGLSLHGSIIKSIRFKLFLSYLFVIAISVLMLGLLSYNESTSIIEAKSALYLEQLSRQIMNNLDRDIYELDRVSFITYYNQYIQDALNDKKSFSYDEMIENDDIIHETFRTVVLSKENTGDVYILSNEGQLRFHFVKSFNNRQEIDFSGNIKEQDWFRKVIEANGKMVLIGVNTAIGKSKITDTFLVARAIRSTPDGKVLGVVLIEESIKALSKIVGEVNIGGNSMLFITDETGNLQFSNNPAGTDELFSEVVGDSKMRKKVFEAEEKNNSRLMIKNEPYLIVSSTSSYSKWKAISLIPVEEFKKDSDALKKISYFICILSLGVCILISIFFSYLIFRPIVSLRRAMEKVEGGDLTVELHVNSNDEIGQLRKGFNRMVGKLNELIHREYNSKILMKQAQLDSLQSQINPHFLYNVLDSIRLEALNKEADNVADMIKILGDMFRYSISKEGNIVRIAEEVKNIENYITLQKFRYDERISVKFDIPSELLEYRILRLILQPIVENAICHGLEPKMESGNIWIAAGSDEEDIVFKVCDNGVGINSDDLYFINNELAEYKTGERYAIGEKIGIFRCGNFSNHS